MNVLPDVSRIPVDAFGRLAQHDTASLRHYLMSEVLYAVCRCASASAVVTECLCGT